MAFVQTVAVNAVSTPGVTPALTTIAVNDLIVVFCGTDVGTTGIVSGVTDSKGNTYTKVPGFETVDATNNLGLTCWYAPVTVGGATTTISVAFNATASNCNVIAQQFNGFTGTPTLDQVKTLANASVTTLTTGASGTTTNANEHVIVGGIHTGTVSAYTLGAGYTNLGTSSVATRDMAAESKVIAATGAQTGTFTIAAARIGIAGLVTFYSAGAGATARRLMMLGVGK